MMRCFSEQIMMWSDQRSHINHKNVLSLIHIGKRIEADGWMWNDCWVVELQLMLQFPWLFSLLSIQLSLSLMRKRCINQIQYAEQLVNLELYSLVSQSIEIVLLFDSWCDIWYKSLICYFILSIVYQMVYLPFQWFLFNRTLANKIVQFDSITAHSYPLNLLGLTESPVLPSVCDLCQPCLPLLLSFSILYIIINICDCIGWYRFNFLRKEIFFASNYFCRHRLRRRRCGRHRGNAVVVLHYTEQT